MKKNLQEHSKLLTKQNKKYNFEKLKKHAIFYKNVIIIFHLTLEYILKYFFLNSARFFLENPPIFQLLCKIVNRRFRPRKQTRFLYCILYSTISYYIIIIMSGTLSGLRTRWRLNGQWWRRISLCDGGRQARPAAVFFAHARRKT